MSDPKSDIQKLIKDHLKREDATGWFEQLYASAQGENLPIPWARMKPDPDLVAWLKAHQVQGDGRRALVVGCGLGDDAEALADAGFNVVAFDISQTAIEMCLQRFPASQVEYVQADLFDLPETWQRAFDFVFESRTIQALPWEYTEPAVQCIAACVKVGGTLLVNCLGRDPEEDRRGIPWHLSRDELALFEKHGLREVNFIDHQSDGAQGARSARRFSVEYRLVEPQP